MLNNLLLFYTGIWFIALLYLFFSKKRISMFSIYFYLYSLFYGPAFYLYFSNPTLSEKIALRCTYSVILFILFYFLGGLLVNSCFKKTYSIERWKNKPIENEYVNIGILLFLFFFSITVLGLGLFVFGGINSIRELFSTGLIESELVDSLRKESSITGPIANVYVYVLPSLGKFISMALYGKYVIEKNLFYFILSVIIIIFEFLGLASNLSKSSLLFYIIQLTIFYFLIYRIKVNLFKILFLIFSLFVLLINIYLLTTNAEDAKIAVDLLLFRVLEEPNRVLALFMEGWPDYYSHTWGLNIRLLHSLFGEGEYIPANVMLCGQLQKGCTFNAIFFAEAYVDFSWWGIITQSFLVGIWLNILDYMIFNRKTWLKIALFSTLVSALFGLVSIALITILIAFGLLMIPVIVKILKLKIT